MNINRLNHKKGMLVIVVAAGLLAVIILLASLLNRMRGEAVLTNRVAINERLNQLASAVGRIAIRKLQRDIEFRDASAQTVFNNITAGTTGKMPLADYTSVLNSLKVISDLKKEFETKWGATYGKLTTFKVEYEIDFGGVNQAKDEPFASPISGVTFNKYERKGYVDMIITVGISHGVTRKYTVRKDFIFARLLAPPFYRFTLFSQNGAKIKNKDVNRISFDYKGEMQSGSKPPLVCINRLRTKSNRAAMNYVNSPSKVIDNKADNFVKNGWIYLGGDGYSTDSRGESGKLILNVVPGSDDDDLSTKFGEYFHFYYSSESAGWLNIDNWNTWLDSKIGSNGKVKMLFVNYGLYQGLLDATYDRECFPEPNTYALFKDYVEKFYGYSVSGSEFELKKGSAMHLFGTPGYCTPTLVFGSVQRRYLRAFALLYEELGDESGVPKFPLRVAGVAATSLYGLYYNDIPGWYLFRYVKKFGGATNFDDTLRNFFLDNYYPTDDTDPNRDAKFLGWYYNGKNSLCGIGPRIVDEEPYMMALHNISKPSDPDLSWQAAVPNNDFCKTGPDALCKKDYVFTSDTHSLYKGNIEEINIDYDTYLKDRTTFTLTASGNSSIKISNNDFIQKHFFSEKEKSIFGKFLSGIASKLFGTKPAPEKMFALNQIIRVEGDLVIDEDLFVDKGGVIVCTGKITIKNPIQNMYLIDEHKTFSGSSPNSFGHLTLVAKNGIEIKSTAGTKVSGEPLPNIHAFLVAGCTSGGDKQVVCDSAMHVIGGVAADKIDDLVAKGGIVEWGFEPDDNITDLKEPSYYSLALGPRDTEIYAGE